jgi:hypothetical protein
VILAYGIGSVTLGAIVALLLQRFGNTPFFDPRHHATSAAPSIPREQLL